MIAKPSNTPSIKHSQRGALFGLDARITLAIFAALSIVAGVAIYGVISQSKVTALSTELDNVGKGYTGFQLDTGVDTTTFTDLITDPGTTGWNGPYVTMHSDSHILYGSYTLVAGTIADNNTPAACGTPCFTWVKLTGVPDGAATDLETTVDGAAGASDTGNLRVTAVGGANDTIYYRIAPQL